jgi:hypothetical protein
VNFFSYVIHVVIHVLFKDKTHVDLEGELSLSDTIAKKNTNWYIKFYYFQSTQQIQQMITSHYHGKVFTPIGSESRAKTEGHPLLTHGSAAFEAE